MTRGKHTPIGTVNVATTGYSMTKVAEGVWELTHRLEAEKKLGRPLGDNERVAFKDGDKTNMAHKNLIITINRGNLTEKRISALKRLIAKYSEELATLQSLEQTLPAQSD